MIRQLTFLLIFVFTGFQIFAQPTAQPSFVRDSLDSYVERALTQWQIPGVAVGIVKDGELVVAKGYGVRELGKPEKVDANTLFMIGSNTKAFTGTALALLEADGKLSLTDPVKKYLPRFDMKDDWVENHLDLQDIVSHRIGMETFQGDFMYWTSDLTSDQVIEKFGKLEPMYPLRTKWGYCNVGFLIAGKVIETVSGKTWAEVLKERIFTPLGMNRTIALSAGLPGTDNAAQAHSMVEGKTVVQPYGLIDNLAPAGSISSSIEDMSHWVIAQLANGKYMGQEVIPANVIARTREPLSIEGRRPSTSSGIRRHYGLYGMGWELSDYDGREIVSHTGGVNGFVTSVTLMPEENLGIIVLTNTDMNGFYVALMREILDAYLARPYQNYSGIYFGMMNQQLQGELAQVKAWQDTIAMNPVTAVPLKDFTGRYEHEAYGWMDVRQDGKALKLTFQHHSKLVGTLEPLGGHRFMLSFNDPLFGIKPVHFTIEDKKVKSFTLQVADFLEFTTYKFVKRA